MPSMCRGCAAFVVLLFACAVAAHAQPQQSDPALPPKPPPPLTSPDRDELRPSGRDKLQIPDRPPSPIRVGPAELREGNDATQALRQSQRTDEFVPISELPPEEQLPAAPMLIAAYVFVVLALFAYLLSVSRRLATVKEEIARLESETRRTGQR